MLSSFRFRQSRSQGQGHNWDGVCPRNGFQAELPGNSGDLIYCSGGFKRSSCSMPLTRLLGMWEPRGRIRDELPQLCSRPWSSLNLTVGTFLEIWLKTKRKDQVAQASSAWAHWRYPHLQKQRGFKGALETPIRSGG